MGLKEYIERSDKFEFQEDSPISFPCCCCMHIEKKQTDFPCNQCGYNMNADLSNNQPTENTL